MTRNRLFTKLIRDLKVSKWQFIAVGFVVMLGVGMFEAGFVSYLNLFTSCDYSYERLRFADFTIAFDRAPYAIVEEIRQIPGVSAAVGRINVERPLEQPGNEAQQIIGRFISLDRDSPLVNDLHIRAGRRLARNARREAILEAGFARYHGYQLGDSITAVVDGVSEDFKIVGLAISPEYILSVRNKQYGMPTPSQFGVAFIPYGHAETLFLLGGQINEICVRSTPGERQKVIDQALEILAPYGPEEPITREWQPSNHLIQQDLQSISSLAVIFPTLFLIAAGLTIYTVLTRLVHAQRTNIGFLRASGFTQGTIVRHYLAYALIVGVGGSFCGIVLGYLLGMGITGKYATILNFPFLSTPLRFEVIGFGMFMGTAFCLAAGSAPARFAGLLSPAVAMRDEAPVKGRTTPLERLFPRLETLPSVFKIPLRNLFRSRRRTFSTAAGVASGISLVMVSGMFFDAIDESLTTYFEEVQKYDALVMFIPHQSQDITYHIRQLPGVQVAQQGLNIPVEIIKNGKSFSTLLLGVPRSSTLYQVLDADRRPARLEGEDIRLGPIIRKRLGVETGDRVLVRYSLSNDDVSAEHWMRVGPPIYQPVTSIVYLPIEVAQRKFGSSLDLPVRPVTGVSVKVDPAVLAGLKKQLYDLPGATAVEVTRETKKDIEDMMEFTNLFIGVMLLFGGGLSFAIIFNTLSVNILERTRELAAMRTLGVSAGQIAVMTTIENVLMGLLGLITGLPLGRLLCHYMITIYQSETVSLEATIYPRTYVGVIVSIMIVVLISQIPALRYINRLDLARAAKERGG